MLLRNKFFVLAIFALFFTLDLGCLEAAWRSAEGGIPVPPNTQAVKKTQRSTESAKYETIYYTSTQSSRRIIDFYRRKLTELGWEERAPVNSPLAQSRIFKKDNLAIAIRFNADAATSENGESRFVLTKKARAISEEEPLVENAHFPAVNHPPQKEIAPDYPQATLFWLEEEPNSLIAVYYSKDDLKNIASFYKNNMPQYGWAIADEAPAEKTEYPAQSLEEYINPETCPDCSDRWRAYAKGSSTVSSQLHFSNAEDAACRIYLTREEAAPESQNELDYTFITVSYEKTK